MAEDIPGVFRDGGPRLNPRKDPAAYLRACAQRYGSVFALTPQHLQVWDPRLAREVLRRENDFVLSPPRVTSSRTSIQIDTSDEWKIARRYAWKYLAAVPGAQRSSLADRWRHELCLRTTFASTTDVVETTAKVLWPALLAETESGVNDELTDVLVSTSKARQRSTRWNSPLWSWRLSRKFRRVIAALTEVVARRRHNDARGDLLDALLAGEEPPLTDVQIAQTLAICLDSALQTTGAAAAWVLSTMSTLAPEEQSQLADEDKAIAFVKEVLRHTPVMAGLNRTTPSSTQLGDFAVAAGTEVIASVEGLHHMPEHWMHDPDDFAPQRWSAEQPHDPGAYLPYGAGPRVCLGMHLANVALVELARVSAEEHLISGPPQGEIYRDNLNWPANFPLRIEQRLAA